MRNLISRMTEGPRLKKYILGYLLGLMISYLLSSVIRIMIGSPAAKAWVPSAALLGFWAAFALWIVTVVFINRYVSRRRSRAPSRVRPDD
jgi:hypothetical protein